MDYLVAQCKRSEIRDFIEKWHYSHNINGLMSDYCFKLMRGDELIGGMIFGRLAMANQWRKYVDSPEKIIELRRLVLVDDTKRNAESYFIGKCLRWLRQNTDIKKVVSYADPEYGHSGVIYKATNFKLVGKSSKGKVIMWNGKKYHDKAIRAKYKGKLKPFAQRLKKALETGQAFYKPTQGKYIYLISLGGL